MPLASVVTDISSHDCTIKAVEDPTFAPMSLLSSVVLILHLHSPSSVPWQPHPAISLPKFFESLSLVPVANTHKSVYVPSSLAILTSHPASSIPIEQVEVVGFLSASSSSHPLAHLKRPKGPPPSPFPSLFPPSNLKNKNSLAPNRL
ncbi:hypothetical protein BJ508DRAFT_126440 [Ascobolus immersus RN42]|uniref:Uncharacterized protein n=1 Tax=Ascobolus immersus RN42 TaxID=1160509 RepID=A0A3N4I3C6_ASCIM|nr:hypothetical protein BJ508DRAFT_126440 [Ascobolus immersus RN42]